MELCASPRVHRARPDSLVHEPARFLDVLELNELAKPHTRMCLRQPDETLQLSSRGDTLFRGTRVVTHIAHLDVGVDELRPSFFGDGRVDIRS